MAAHTRRGSVTGKQGSFKKQDNKKTPLCNLLQLVLQHKHVVTCKRASCLTPATQSLLDKLDCTSRAQWPRTKKRRRGRGCLQHIAFRGRLLHKAQNKAHYLPTTQILPAAWPPWLSKLIPQRSQTSANCCGHSSSTKYKDPQSPVSTGVTFLFKVFI